jgi:6-phosphogluconolactonase (cycloisomerase 2 family)
VAAAVAVLLSLTGVAWAVKGELSFQGRAPEFDLGSTTGLVTSPDGKNIYATGDSSLTVLSRDPATGAFDYLETERDDLDDPSDPGGVVNGLTSARDVAISADGKNVYGVGWQGDNAISVFARDPATGRLSFIEAERDGVNDAGDPGGTVEELFRPEAVAVSPDGGSVYSVSETDDSVVAFERNTSTGRLSYLEFEKNGVNDAGDAGGTVEGFEGGTDVAVAPDGEGLYATGDDSDSVVVFERDTGNGELSFVEFEKDGVDDAGDAGETVNGLNGARAAAVSPDNEFVYIAGEFDRAIAMFERDTATEELSFIEAEVDEVDDAGDAGGEVTGLLSPEGVGVSPDGANLYAADNASNSVTTFRFVPATDQLVFIETETTGIDPEDGGATPTGLVGPRRIAVTADGAHVYAGGNGTAGLATFSRSAPGAPNFGQLGFLFTSPSFSLFSPRGVAIAPDGRNMVISTLGDDSVRSFGRDPATGAVQLRDTETQEVDDPSDAGPQVAGLEEPKAVVFSPDGRDLYVTDTSSYSVSLFQLNPASGELTYVESETNNVNDPADPGGEVEGLYEPWDVVVSADGKSLYSSGSYEDSVAAFQRDPATGKLSFAEVEKEGVGGVEGLGGIQGLAISPDGASVYAAGRDEEEAAAFSRNPATSALSFLESEHQGEDDPNDPGGAVDGIASGPDDVIVSRDGDQVYFSGSDTVARFDRDSATGRISFAEVERDGINDPNDAGGAVEGLESVRKLEISQDGRELYAGSSNPLGSVTTFARSAQTGALSFLEVERTGIDDPTDPGGVVSGMGRLEDLVASPDDRHLYAAGESENGFAIFSREDDFAAPETTITSGPGEGETIADSTPTFGFSSSEAGSTFGCEVDGAETTCQGDLAPLGDGPHTFTVAATDQEGNTDTSPASRAFTVDTALVGGRVKASKKQRQKGKKIAVKLTLTASEAADGTASGKVLIGKKSYRLKPVTRALQPGKGRVFTLKPAKAKQRKKVVAALNGGAKVKAKLTGKIVDGIGNRYSRTLTVRLKRAKAR